MSRNLKILVGDANGVDSLIQKYLCDKNYSNVTVYHVRSHIRNNIGHWTTVSIDGKQLSGRAIITKGRKR